MSGLFETAKGITAALPGGRILAGPLGVGSMVLQGAVEGGHFLAAEAIKRGGDVKFHTMPATTDARLRAEKLMDEMRHNAKAIELYKKTL